MRRPALDVALQRWVTSPLDEREARPGRSARARSSIRDRKQADLARWRAIIQT
jgi:hypothetical protein